MSFWDFSCQHSHKHSGRSVILLSTGHIDTAIVFKVITARIPRLTGGYIFTGVYLFIFSGGGTLIQPMGVYPHPSRREGTPIIPDWREGYPLPRSGQGEGVVYTFPGLNGGTYFPGWVGVPPLPRSEWGYPFFLTGGGPYMGYPLSIPGKEVP